MFVPVKTKDGQQLMPLHAARARKLIKKGEATPYWSNGIYCIRLNKEPSDRETQEICVGVDPGSKKEGFTVKSEVHTYLNIQADAHTHTSKKVKNRRELRRGRRSRKCPNRKKKPHNLSNMKRIPAGTRARWDWKLRILNWSSKLYPVTQVCVEDIKARTKQYQKKWNQSFSPIEVGKQWFYSEIEKRWQLHTLLGHETKDIRDKLGLKKSKDKKAETFNAHCVDSWCLAYHVLGGDPIVDNTDIFCISPISIQRRNLHREIPKKGGIRTRYGGTRCLGYTKGTLVKSIKWGLCWISGHQNGKINLTQMTTGKHRPQQKLESFKILKRLNFKYKVATSPS
ncbi:hypothetical protein C6503_10375 [Candidatus Poribacteria bacterium]|nr:MAG: hypothetical protein C6503_10375 [Candidatus Poribacteria bacterium]